MSNKHNQWGKKRWRAELEMLRDTVPGAHVFAVGVATNGRANNKGHKEVLYSPRFGFEKGKNKEDILPELEQATLYLTGKNVKRIKKLARDRFGKLLFCRKVDTSDFFEQIEHLKLNQKPLVVSVELERQFALGKDMSVVPLKEQDVNVPLKLDKG